MTPEITLPNRLQTWWLAIRPRTLPAAAAGVVAGSALALHDRAFRPLPALAALLVALLLQIGSNLANDVFDYERGADSARSHGPVRVTQSGLLTPGQVKAGMGSVFALAGLIGLYLAFEAGWVVILIGLAAILSAIAYTGGPFPLGYYGLGDLFVFLFFGLACVAGTYFVQAGKVSPAAWWMSLPVGLIIVGILVVNNLRDIETDRLAGKHTLAVRLGERFAKGEYLSCLLVAFLCLPVLSAFGVLPWWSLLAWVTLPLTWKITRLVFTQKGKALNAALAGTGQLALAFSVLFLVGQLLALLA
jgi:1,4-dihydroxy-2-naphthoate octaprenyltransferase